MIGKIISDKSFYHCLKYCLEDKQELTVKEKKNLSEKDQVQHENRAEVLEYNLSFGDLKERSEQFRDVQKLSRRVEKPVLHMTLRFAPGERLDEYQLANIGRACAQEFGVRDHQYWLSYIKNFGATYSYCRQQGRF